MLCHSQHCPYFSTAIFHGHRRPNPNPNPNSTILHLKPLLVSFREIKSNATLPSSSSAESSIPVQTLSPSDVSRRQNASFTALFHFHSQGSAIHSSKEEEILGEEELQRKRVIEEASLATKKIPRFPGSLDFPKAEQFGFSADLNPDEEDIRKAIEVRRGVAAEILKEALRAGKLSINYSSNLVSRLPVFIDRVVIGAAAMKGISEFKQASFNVRAKSYLQSSGVVALVKWLKHNSMTYPQIGKVICMHSGDLAQVKRTAEWLKSIYVKGKDLGAVFTKASVILGRSPEEMEEVIDYLIDNGVRREWVGFVVTRCPQLLTLTMKGLESRVRFFLNMDMNKEDFGTMVYEYPRVLGFFSLDEMDSKIQYLKEFGLNTKEVGQLLAIKPQLMGCSIEDRWKPLVKYLYYLGVRREGMKRMLLVKPMIFCVDLETTISPKVRFLQDLGIREEAIGSVLVKFPPLLTYSLYKKIRPVVIFLMSKAGVTQTNIAKVIAFDPQLIGCSIVKKLEINVKYFMSLGIRSRCLGAMITDFPMLLRYNLDIVRPKYRYLRRVMVRPLEDLIEFPRFLSYSLEGRIVPRHKVLVANRINFKLRYMLAGSDEEFNQRVRVAVENRRRFEFGDAKYDAPISEFSEVPTVFP